MHVKKAEAQPLQTRVELVAQIRHDFALGQPRRGHIIPVSQNGPQHGLRHNGQGQRRDDLQAPSMRRRRPAERITRRRCWRVQRVPDDINHHAQQLQAEQTQQQENQAQARRKQEVGAIPPGQGQQAPDEFPGGVLAAGLDAGWLEPASKSCGSALVSRKSRFPSYCNPVKKAGRAGKLAKRALHAW
jgi:hypothetical protein